MVSNDWLEYTEGPDRGKAQASEPLTAEGIAKGVDAKVEQRVYDEAKAPGIVGGTGMDACQQREFSKRVQEAKEWRVKQGVAPPITGGTWPYSQSTKPTVGWSCPNCGRCYGPHIASCSQCIGMQYWPHPGGIAPTTTPWPRYPSPWYASPQNPWTYGSFTRAEPNTAAAPGPPPRPARMTPMNTKPGWTASPMVNYERALTLAWNAATKGKGVPDRMLIEVGQAIWDYWQTEMTALTRWVEDHAFAQPTPAWVAFKSARMQLNTTLVPDEFHMYAQVHKGRCSEPQANGTGLDIHA